MQKHHLSPSICQPVTNTWKETSRGELNAKLLEVQTNIAKIMATNFPIQWAVDNFTRKARRIPNVAAPNNVIPNQDQYHNLPHNQEQHINSIPGQEYGNFHQDLNGYDQQNHQENIDNQFNLQED